MDHGALGTLLIGLDAIRESEADVHRRPRPAARRPRLKMLYARLTRDRNRQPSGAGIRRPQPDGALTPGR